MCGNVSNIVEHFITKETDTSPRRPKMDLDLPGGQKHDSRRMIMLPGVCSMYSNIFTIYITIIR